MRLRIHSVVAADPNRKKIVDTHIITSANVAIHGRASRRAVPTRYRWTSITGVSASNTIGSSKSRINKGISSLSDVALAKADRTRIERYSCGVGSGVPTLVRAKYLLYAFRRWPAAVMLGWLATQSYAVHQLSRGVGDTWFHTADGRRWFRLDEQRHDVPITAIAPHLQNAFVAVEDHRFFMHPGVDPIALGRAVIAQRAIVGHARRRQHHHAAARAHPVSVESPELRPQGARSRARGPHRAAVDQAADSRVVSQSHLPWRRHLRRRDHVAARVRQAREESVACRERADRRPRPRAVGAVALVQPRRSGHAQPCRAGADARRGVHYRRFSSRTRSGRAFRCGRIAARTTARHGYAKAYLRQRFRDEFGGDHPPDWRVDTTFVVGAAGCGRARGRERAPQHRQAGAASGAASPSIPPPATCSRSSAAATISARPSTAPAAAGASQDPRSSRLCSRPRSNAACRRSRSSPASIASRRKGRTSGPRAMSATMRRRADAAAALHRVEQPCRHRVAATASARGACCAWPPTPASTISPTCRRSRSAAGLVTPLATDRRLRDVSQRRLRRPAARHHPRPRCRRRHGAAARASKPSA